MHRSLLGGRIQRLAVGRVGGCDVAVLDVRVPAQIPDDSGAETVHVLVAGGVDKERLDLRVGICEGESRARLRAAMRAGRSPIQAHWRARLEGGRVAGVGARGISVVVEGTWWYAGSAAQGRLELTEQAADPAAEPENISLAEMDAGIVDELVSAGVGARRDAMARALRRALARIDRRIAAVQVDLARMTSVEAAAESARSFVAPAAQAPRGATRIEAVDWSSGQPRRVEMRLDPARTAREQVEALFKRARRLKQGAHVATKRLEDARRARDTLASVTSALDSSEEPDFDRLEAQARLAAPRDFRIEPAGATASPRGVRKQAPRLSYRMFLGASGCRILVGRGAADNDALTFHVGRPHDLWLHAKNRAGAHVIVPLDKGASCPGDALVEAAHLAAYFSDARDERVVEVQYVPRRHLRKPRGSAPGFVVVEREKVIVLRREDDLLRRLLEREEDASYRVVTGP